jgi:hypothetical protein
MAGAPFRQRDQEDRRGTRARAGVSSTGCPSERTACPDQRPARPLSLFFEQRQPVRIFTSFLPPLFARPLPRWDPLIRMAPA